MTALGLAYQKATKSILKTINLGGGGFFFIYYMRTEMFVILMSDVFILQTLWKRVALERLFFFESFKFHLPLTEVKSISLYYVERR